MCVYDYKLDHLKFYVIFGVGFWFDQNRLSPLLVRFSCLNVITSALYDSLGRAYEVGFTVYSWSGVVTDLLIKSCDSLFVRIYYFSVLFSCTVYNFICVLSWVRDYIAFAYIVSLMHIYFSLEDMFGWMTFVDTTSKMSAPSWERAQRLYDKVCVFFLPR